MMLATKIAKNLWCNLTLKRQLCLTSKVDMKVPKGAARSQKVLLSQKYKFLRKLEGFPPVSRAPHIKLIYNSDYENYVLFYNPFTLVSTPIVIFLSNERSITGVFGESVIMIRKE